MKNNYRLGMLVATTLFLASSCQNEDLGDNLSDSPLLFSVSVENIAGTRADNNSTDINKLYYAIFDGNIKVDNGVVTKQADQTKFNVISKTLAKGTYKAAFWAHNEACDDYYQVDITNNSMDVTIAYDNEIKNNDPNTDAFFSINDVTVSNQTIDITLKRPFAQINVGVTQADWEKAVAKNVTVSQSATTIKGAPNKLNLLTGEVSGSEDVTYTMSDIFPLTEKLSVNNVDYVYLSMCYVLADKTGDTKEMEFAFNTSASPISLEEGLQSVPARRNYRTNIIGDLLNGAAQFNVHVDYATVGFGGSDSIHSTVVQQGTCGPNTTWTLYATGELIIDGTGLTTSAPWLPTYETNIKTVYIGDGVESVTDNAFYYCENLERVHLPNSVTTIGSGAFSFCSGLESINIPNSVTSIGSNAFIDCFNLQSIDIPHSITSIESGTFSHCRSLTNIDIPISITSIGDWAFGNCINLTSITIPNSVTSIGDQAFRSCKSLSSIYLQSTTPPSYGNSVVDNPKTITLHVPTDAVSAYSTANGWKTFSKIVGENMMIDQGSCGTDVTWTLYTTGELVIEGTGDITSYPWSTYNASIKNILIKNGVSSIPSQAFSNCSNMYSVMIPNSVTSIGTQAFSNCTKLTSINIPNLITQINANTFNGCSNLTSITIPNSVASIEDEAFQGCSNLKNIYLQPTIPPTGTGNIPSSVWETATLYVPSSAIDAYTATDGWKDFTNIVGI